MKNIALRFTYNYCIISVPEYIEKDILKFRKQFFRWLYNKSNNHSYWVYMDGEKRAVSYDWMAFVEYLNKFHVSKENDKVFVVEEKTNTIPDGLVVLEF